MFPARRSGSASRSIPFGGDSPGEPRGKPGEPGETVHSGESSDKMTGHDPAPRDCPLDS